MSTASITLKTRMVVQDQGEPFVATIPSVDGVSTQFSLTSGLPNGESFGATSYVILQGILQIA
jgi:hypothetical protein